LLKHKDIGYETILTHAGSHPDEHCGFINPPVFRGSTVVFPTLEAMTSGTQQYQYGRWNNPNTAALAELLTLLDGAEGTVLCPSGLSACAIALLSVASAGDHVLVSDSVYGPMRHFCETLGHRMGIETSYYDPRAGAGIEASFKPNTRAVYTESPGSYTLEVQDLPAIASVAHRRGALVITDNTWATSLFCKPLSLGADITVMAATKYIVGHSDALVGTISAGARAWEKVKATHFELGMYVGPDDVSLALRGFRTMGIRLKQHQENASAVATWLSKRSEVEQVLYPALPTHPDHNLWLRDFTGASGLLSLVLRPAPHAALEDFLNHLELFSIGYSWGGYESLVMTMEPRKARTATDWTSEGHLVRLHVGLENADDLIADLEAGLIRFRGGA
jgi:cysteine-S-conjugate beta-lyase